MRKILFIVATIAVMCGCTGVKSMSKGLENEAYLDFIGEPVNYKRGIQVKIDSNILFEAVVRKDSRNKFNNKIYSISPGKHEIVISHNNKVIYKKTIFVSSQETKQIMLP